MRKHAWLMPAAVVLAVSIGCGGGSPPSDEATREGIPATEAAARDHYPLARRDYFHAMDGVRDAESGQYTPLELTEEEIQGRNAWMMWTGGNQAFWDWLARHGYGSMDLLRILDSNERGERFARRGLITEPNTRPPTAEETREANGIRYDRLAEPVPNYLPNPNVYGYSSGIMGLRLFPNPEFTGSAAARWDPQRYYSDAEYAARPDTIRPFRVGMSCAFCHVGPHPLNPPENPEEPGLENLSGTIGNQYLRPRAVFGNRLTPNNYLYHVLDAQMPGTIDTSLVASDNVNNANTMNAIFGLGWRVERALANPPETLSAESAVYPGLWSDADRSPAALEGNPRHVPRVLVDGSDSVGTWLALARVYLNIGTYHQQWNRLHNPFLGFRTQQPFKAADCEANSVYWHATKNRVDAMTAFFLKATDPMRLKDAPGGHDRGDLQGEGVPWDPAYAEGRRVFASACIACHSSIQPGDSNDLEVAITERLTAQAGDNAASDDAAGDEEAREQARGALDRIGSEAQRATLQLRTADLERLTRGDGSLPPAYAAWARAAVEHLEFWQTNYLSTDLRIPVTVTHTNSARAMATNSVHDNMWEDFASRTFKELDSVGRIGYRDPFSGAEKSFEAPSGGPGYYRVPTLISAWATAPYLHNNALGNFNNDPSVEGRLEAFEDGIEKLLWPELRRQTSHDRGTVDPSDDVRGERMKADGGLVWRTTQETWFLFHSFHIPHLVAGATGWTAPTVRLVTWLPALGFLVLGVLFLLIRQVVTIRELASRRWPWSAGVARQLRWVAFFLLLALAAGAAYFVWKYWLLLKLLEMMSEWRFPWLRIQAVTPTLGLVALAIFVIYHTLPLWLRQQGPARLIGLGCLVLAVVLGLGFGRFLSGLSDDLRLGPLPAEMPVNVLANMDPHAPLPARKAAFKALSDYLQEYHASPDARERPGRKEFEEQVAPTLMSASKCPDFVMDRGHDYVFIRRWPDEDKTALIELLKTF